MKKRRHHYVWRHYLEPWTIDGTIACLRGGRTFRASTANVGVETDFYRLRDLLETDRNFLHMIVGRSASHLHRMGEGWIEALAAPSRLKEQHQASVPADARIEGAFDEVFSNLEEDLHEKIEKDAMPLLRALQGGDGAFFETGDGFSTFMYFLSVQYMRTKKLRDRVCANCRELPIDVGNLWGILRHIFATNMGAEFVLKRQDYRLTFLESPPGAQFLTSDQPVLNTLAAESDRHGIPEELEFLYPVTPRRAVLIGREEGHSRPRSCSLTTEDADRYNRVIAGSAHEQLFARDEAILKRFRIASSG